MKMIFVLLLIGCSTNQNGDSKQVTGGDCIYHEAISVTLDFKSKEKEEDEYIVSYSVKGYGNSEFIHGATLNKDCNNEFESKKIIPAFMEKIKWGSCNPLIIKPKIHSLSPECIKMF